MNRYREAVPSWFLVLVFVSALVALVGIVGYSTGLIAPEPESETVVATPIVPPTTMADLLRTPTPTATLTPTPEPTISAPSVSVASRVVVAAPPPVNVDYADWYVTQLAFPPAEQYRALRTAWCESMFDDAAVGEAGEIGRWQIHPLWMDDPGVHEIVESWFPGATGSVETFTAALHHEHVNAQVAAYIQGKNGWRPWTTRFGCPGWQG